MNLATIQSYDLQRWRSVADTARSSIETRLFINGEYTDAAAGGRFSTINPANGEVMAEMSEGMPTRHRPRCCSRPRRIPLRLLVAHGAARSDGRPVSLRRSGG